MRNKRRQLTDCEENLHHLCLIWSSHAKCQSSNLVASTGLNIDLFIFHLPPMPLQQSSFFPGNNPYGYFPPQDPYTYSSPDARAIYWQGPLIPSSLYPLIEPEQPNYEPSDVQQFWGTTCKVTTAFWSEDFEHLY